MFGFNKELKRAYWYFKHHKFCNGLIICQPFKVARTGLTECAILTFAC